MNTVYHRIREWLIVATAIYIIVIIFIAGPVEFLRVTSGSMEPAIMTGSICVVDRGFDTGRIEVGDVIVFLAMNDTLVCHRVNEINSYGFVTKGDANSVCDLFTVTKDNYYGKVLFSF